VTASPALQVECADLLDEILCRPDHLLQMWLEPGSVRGGIRGHEHDDRCLAFEARQAQRFQMSVAPSTRLS